LLGAAEKFEKKLEKERKYCVFWRHVPANKISPLPGIETKQDEDEAVLRPEKSSMTTLCCLLGASLTG
jgi:hypothetical protein